MSLRRSFFLLSILAAATILAVIGAKRLARSAVPHVDVAHVRFGPLESWITTNGIIEPTDPHVIRAPVATFVTTVRVAEGQLVKRGDPLLTLDLDQQRADLARAREDVVKAENDLRVFEAGGPMAERAQVESDLRKADAEATLLGRQLESTERLVAKQAAMADELSQTKLALARANATRDALAEKQEELKRGAAMSLDVARLSVERAREARRMIEAQVQSAEIQSPGDGTVYALPARAGSRVDVGAVLAYVADLTAVQLRAFVDQPELAAIEPNQLVEVSWSAVPNQVWKGRTVRVPKTIVSRGDRMVGEVLCSVSNDSQQLIPNLGVDVRIRVQSRSRTLLVPRQAVRNAPGGRYVFVVEGETVRRRPVVVDVASTTDYSVAQGLGDGERVALPGDLELRDGMRVQASSTLP